MSSQIAQKYITSKFALIRVAYKWGLTQLTLTDVIVASSRAKESGDVAEYAWYCIPQYPRK